MRDQQPSRGLSAGEIILIGLIVAIALAGIYYLFFE